MKKLLITLFIVAIVLSSTLSGCKSINKPTVSSTPVATAPIAEGMSQMYGGAGADLLTSVIAMTDGGVVIAGTGAGSAGTGNLIKFEKRKGSVATIARLDSKGKIVWHTVRQKQDVLSESFPCMG